MSRDADDARGRANRALSPEQRERFRSLGADRFKDHDHQQWARSHRTKESLRAGGRAGWAAMVEIHGREILSRAGKLGWAATVAKHGEEFAWDRAAETRRERPTAPERAMIALLGELGQREHIDYQREYKVAPRTHVDFAWPDQGRAAIEVYGGVHFGPFDADGARAAYDSARVARIEDLGWHVFVVTSIELQAVNRDATRDHLRAFLQAEPTTWADRGREMLRHLCYSATQLLLPRR